MIILVGGGDHCRSVINIAEYVGYNIIGILDIPDNVGKSVFNYKIIGVDDDIPKYVNDALFIVTVGSIKDASLRIKLHNKIITAGGKLATVIASTAVVSKYSKISEGTVKMHQAAIDVDAVIGKGCFIGANSVIAINNVHITDNVVIGAGSVVIRDIVNSGTYIGNQARLLVK